MNELYAIQPSAFRDYKDLKHLLDKFGFHEGRLIASFPKRWLKMVYEHLDQWPEGKDSEGKNLSRDIERSQAKSYIDNYVREALFPVGCNYEKLDKNELNSWLANAEKLVDDEVIENVIVEKDRAGRFPSIEDVWNDNSDSILVRSREITVIGNAKNYSEVAKRLIQASPEIILIDAYFTLNRPNRAKVLDAFIQVAQDSKHCESIKIISLDDPDRGKRGGPIPDELLRQFSEKILAGICKKDVKIHWQLVSDEDAIIRLDNEVTVGKRKIHPRYMVSLRGGLRFDNGFEEFADNQVVDISTLDKYKCKEVYNLYAENAAGFKTVREVRWDGNRVSVTRRIPINN